MHLLAKFGTEIEISFPISILTWMPRKNLITPPQPAILGKFLNQEYRIIILKSQIWLTEKQEEEEEGEREEQRQLQSITCFTETQQM